MAISCWKLHPHTHTQESKQITINNSTTKTGGELKLEATWWCLVKPWLSSWSRVPLSHVGILLMLFDWNTSPSKIDVFARNNPLKTQALRGSFLWHEAIPNQWECAGCLIVLAINLEVSSHPRLELAVISGLPPAHHRRTYPPAPWILYHRLKRKHQGEMGTVNLWTHS